MRFKRKKKKRLTLKKRFNLSSTSEQESDPNTFRLKSKKGKPFITHWMFTSQINAFVTLTQVVGYVSEWYQIIFGKFPPLSKQPLELIKLKLETEILKREAEITGSILSQKTQQNYLAAQEFNIEKLTKGLKYLVKLKLEYPGGTDMNKIKKINSKKGKAKGLKITAASVYLALFLRQEKDKLTDDQIAIRIKKETGTEPTARNIASYRCYYNQGQIKGQTKKPAVKVVALRGKKKVTAPAKSKKILKTKKKLILKKKKKK